MSADQDPLNITILDKEYMISCEEDERELLRKASIYLNGKRQELKDSGRVIGMERVAVMAALDITHELLAYKQENDGYTNSVDDTIRRLQNKIDDALVKGRQYEM